MSQSIDFRKFPKQWIVVPTPLPHPVGGRTASFGGRHVQAAEAVPLVPVEEAGGRTAALVIGWVVAPDGLRLDDAPIRLNAGEGPEALFERLSGRFAMLWQDERGLALRLDSNGSLAAVHLAAEGIVASTTSLVETQVALEADRDVEAIFAFPRRRGFLPFGLTPRRGVRRLLPGFRLDLADFGETRIWSASPKARVDEAEAPTLARRAGDILAAQMKAILSVTPATVFLSGGHDSRILLAAARGRTERLSAQTFGPPGSLETYLAGQVARRAGVAHEAVAVAPASDAAVAAWLHRTGYTFYDPVTQMTETVTAHPPQGIGLAGTGAELSRASNWTEEDAAADRLTLEVLRARIRVPDLPVINHAAEAWLATLPPTDAALALDMAKIEQIHACWSGVEVYGHDLPRPTLNPFSGQRLNEVCLRLPKTYRLRNGFYADLMAHLWPDLARLPVNRARGLARARFWRDELRAAIPPSVKRRLKPLR